MFFLKDVIYELLTQPRGRVSRRLRHRFYKALSHARHNPYETILKTTIQDAILRNVYQSGAQCIRDRYSTEQIEMLAVLETFVTYLDYPDQNWNVQMSMF